MNGLHIPFEKLKKVENLEGIPLKLAHANNNESPQSLYSKSDGENNVSNAKNEPLNIWFYAIGFIVVIVIVFVIVYIVVSRLNKSKHLNEEYIPEEDEYIYGRVEY
ncbi:ORF96 [Agrotis segetum granulovirus]|uniref:ORF96 n=1 Tax=Agrotis segetum granulosis virus TaxID=10464 RepID=Q6QXL6_GVAS|nr:hypothetical protein AsGV110 [Agrotis segetum granulovirus]AAS82642.1 ORF96 [Agrotis segetum granulovirus]AHN92146.1 hypothetical protein AsGV107 [Agrotis segetum granulovirus]AKN63384.1 hypothetical protein AsGV110 [Agrotis segetum granulovirus]